jgi:hypothetical protein
MPRSSLPPFNKASIFHFRNLISCVCDTILAIDRREDMRRLLCGCALLKIEPAVQIKYR